MSGPVPTVTLNDGTKMPVVGLGCWMGGPGGGKRVNEMCAKALKAGYRHFDTAAGYSNEKEVGEALRTSGVPRKELYITTKLANSDHHRVREAFDKSLQELDCEYIDLYLLHWPQGSISDTSGAANASYSRVFKPTESPTFVEVWKEMEKLLETGKVKTIGVSNFSVKTLQELLPHATIIPAVNQIETHPCLPQNDLKKYSDEKGIVTVAYSPLGRSSTFFEHEGIKAIAAKNNTSVAQVVLSWGVQRGTVVIPKSESEQRLKDNITLITLSQTDMEAVDRIHKEPGMHKSLLTYHSPDGSIFGWTYEEMGWNMLPGGIVKDA